MWSVYRDIPLYNWEFSVVWMENGFMFDAIGHMIVYCVQKVKLHSHSIHSKIRWKMIYICTCWWWTLNLLTSCTVCCVPCAVSYSIVCECYDISFSFDGFLLFVSFMIISFLESFASFFHICFLIFLSSVCARFVRFSFMFRMVAFYCGYCFTIYCLLLVVFWWSLIVLSIKQCGKRKGNRFNGVVWDFR